MKLKSREIKFRAYSNNRKEIYLVTFIDFSKKIIFLRVEETVRGEWYVKNGFSEVVLMQYTGLKDSDGVDIYEGDIVEHLDGEYSFRGVVVYSPFGWYVNSTEDNISFEHFADEQSETADCTVIGNVYE